MTLVATIVTDHYALMIGDMRRTNMLTGVYCDDAPKLHRINDYLIMGTGGDPTLAKNIMGAIAPSFPTHGRIELMLEALKAQMAILCQLLPPEQTEVSFHLTGLNKANKMCLGSLSFHDDFQAKLREVEDGSYIYQVGHADYNPVDWLDQRLKENKDHLNPDAVRRIAKKLVKHTAARDKYVSPECTTLSVKRWGGESPPPRDRPFKKFTHSGVGHPFDTQGIKSKKGLN